MAGAVESVGSVQGAGSDVQAVSGTANDTGRSFDQSLAAASNPDPEGLLPLNSGQPSKPANDNPDPEGLLPLPTGTPASPAPTAGGAPAPTGGGHYSVQPGDTLSAIAEHHGLTLDQLVALNPQLQNRDLNLIDVGESITVSASPAANPDPEGLLPLGALPPLSAAPDTNPDPEGLLPLPNAPSAGAAQGAVAQPGSAISATVEPGDSLSAIAERHGLALDQLVALNPQLQGRDLNLIHPGETFTVGRVPDLNPDPEGLLPLPKAPVAANPDPEGLLPLPKAPAAASPDPEGLLPLGALPDPTRVDIGPIGPEGLTQAQKDQLKDQAIQLIGAMRGYGTLGAGALDGSSGWRELPVTFQGLGTAIYDQTVLDDALKSLESGDWGKFVAHDLPALNKAWTTTMNSLQTNGLKNAGAYADTFASANKLQALGNIGYILAVHDGGWGQVSHDSATATVDALKKLSTGAQYDTIVNKVLEKEALQGTKLGAMRMTPETSAKLQNWMLGLTATLDVMDKIAKMNAISEGDPATQVAKTGYANALTANDYGIGQYLEDIKEGAPEFAKFIVDNPEVGAQIATELGINAATSYALNQVIVGLAQRAGGTVTAGSVLNSIISRLSTPFMFFYVDPEMMSRLTGPSESDLA